MISNYANNNSHIVFSRWRKPFVVGDIHVIALEMRYTSLSFHPHLLMKRHLISFADSRMKKALLRLQKQAENMQFFDEILVLTEQDLDTAFRQKFHHILSTKVRGFGFWIWKPYIIQRGLNNLQDGDELYYVDAGCHWNPAGRARLLEYARALESCPLGIAAFELGSKCSERAFSKMDVLLHMNVQNNSHIIDTGQLCATHVFCRKCTASMSFVNDWLNLCQNLHLIDDTPSLAAEFPEFEEHRHDQSIFSILCKLRCAERLPGNETWPANNTRDWSSLRNYPIWDKRDLGCTSHLLARMLRKAERYAHKILNL